MCEDQVLVKWFSLEIQLCSGRLHRSQSYSPPPQDHVCKKRVLDFVANFAKAGKGFTEIK
jgi:hypothetical protein